MLGALTTVLALLLTCSVQAQDPAPSQAPVQPNTRPRARELGIMVGVLPTGPLNAITDVKGVLVGQTTMTRGNGVQNDDVRTGVTAILPHGGNLFREKVPGAVFIGNAFGKLAGATQVQELGEIETPILLTSTLSVPRVADALLDYMLALPGNEDVQSINPLVGETNDGGLNNIRSRSVGPQEVLAAINSAKSGPVAEGSVGAGTGTVAFGFKGGIGTASRRLPAKLGGYTVGVLVQTNFGGVLTINGAPVGRELGRYYLQNEIGQALPNCGSAELPNCQPADLDAKNPNAKSSTSAVPQFGSSAIGADRTERTADSPDGSCMIVVATDAPLDARNLRRLAARAIMGLARTGSAGSNGSGDYVIAFSAAPEVRIHHGVAGVQSAAALTNEAVSPLFLAVIEATEEAIYNSLFKATTVTGRGRTVEALPIERTLEILREHKAISK